MKNTTLIRTDELERILLETDCPVRYQGRDSRPADVLITAGEVAKIRGISMEEVAAVTSHNTETLYGFSV